MERFKNIAPSKVRGGWGEEKWNEENIRNRAFSSLMKSRNKAVWKRQSHKISESKNKYMEVVSLCMFIWIERGGE